MIRQHLVLTLSLAATLSLAVFSSPLLHASESALQQTTKHRATYPHATTWLLLRAGQDAEVVHGDDLAQTLQTPASTFKPLLALIALQTGELRDADEIVPWDGRRYPSQPQWQKDMALAEAMLTSSESYFRSLAERIGRDRLAAWVARVGYGDGQVGDRAETAWHVGGLSITAQQQLQFIDRLRRNDLPFDRRHIDSVKRAMLSFDNNDVRIYGKTGTSLPQGKSGLGWWVGWVERANEQTSFVLLAELTQFDGREQRLAHANALLLEAGILTELP